MAGFTANADYDDMSDATDRLIETAVRRIDDNAELKVATAAEFAKMARDDLKPGNAGPRTPIAICGTAIWCEMGFCLAAVAGYRFRVSILGRKLAVRFGDLLDGGDWRWIPGAGTMLPFLYGMAMNRLTPLGGRDFGISGTAWLLPAGMVRGLFAA